MLAGFKNFKKKLSKKPRFKKFKKRIDSYLKRRPHRSFRLSRKRDYNRSLKLPSYLRFNKYVFKILISNRRLFLSLVFFCTFVMLITGLIASQSTFSELRIVLDETSNGVLDGNWGEASKAALLFFSSLSGGISGDFSEVQQVYFIIIILLFWLTNIWLLRNILAKRKVKLRDGLYNAGAPIFATMVVAILLIIQLLPMALVIIAYSSAVATEFLSGGIESMLFFLAAFIVIIMCLYFITSTLFALVIVTLPGMSPSEAVRTAGDLVMGRRLRLLARLLWLAVSVVIVWLIIIIPTIMLSSWAGRTWQWFNSVPVLPIVFVFMISVTVVWASSYIYLLYRKVIKDESSPA